jgi:hypothetical protein
VACLFTGAAGSRYSQPVAMPGLRVGLPERLTHPTQVHHGYRKTFRSMRQPQGLAGTLLTFSKVRVEAGLGLLCHVQTLPGQAALLSPVFHPVDRMGTAHRHLDLLSMLQGHGLQSRGRAWATHTTLGIC